MQVLFVSKKKILSNIQNGGDHALSYKHFKLQYCFAFFTDFEKKKMRQEAWFLKLNILRLCFLQGAFQILKI